MLDAEAQVVQTADGLIPAELLGLDRFEARKRVVELLEGRGRCCEKVEDRVDRQTPYGDRSRRGDRAVADRPMVCRRRDAGQAARSRRCASGEIEIVPEDLEEDLVQLAGEHPALVRLAPALVGPPDSGLVSTTTATSSSPRPRKKRRPRRATGVALRRDDDVLDTWFSSALWPFATLGWPGADRRRCKRHYPNDVLISGFDILFFWDARMAMQGMQFMGEVPWKTLYLHGLVRDADGAEDVQVEGQYGRSARPDRQIWRRRAALHHGGDGKPGPRHQAR